MMTFRTGHTPFHKGRTTTTEPIRGEHIAAIKELLKDRPRDRAIWAVATNCALRAGDLLDLRWDQLEDDGERISFRVRESKTTKLRYLVLNPSVSDALRSWRTFSDSEWCFSGQRGKLTVPALGRMVKHWAQQVGHNGQIASHSLRKTWCRAMVDQFDEPLYKMMAAFGHSSELQTAQYVGLLRDDVAALYEHVV